MFQTELYQACTALGLSIQPQQMEQYTKFFEYLVEINKVMNLTKLTAPDEVALKHMADSLSCYDEEIFKVRATVLDLGTGAGFPGIPLKIYRPDLQLTFFDSLKKRLQFISCVTDLLQIKQTVCLHGRAEDLAHQDVYREQFDLVTSRAVARLSVLAEWALPYVKKGGYMIALKGARYETELKAAERAVSLLGGTVYRVRKVQLGNLPDIRAVIYIRKTHDSPRQYPRKPKVASAHPL